LREVRNPGISTEAFWGAECEANNQVATYHVFATS
jgi:hypothetical protein